MNNQKPPMPWYGNVLLIVLIIATLLFIRYTVENRDPNAIESYSIF